jgi:proteasome lid subunit RPN8/RPN11
MTIALPAAIEAALCEHARSGAPKEVVGVLAGSHNDTDSTVRRAYRAKNAATEPRARYEIAPGEEIELLERIDSDGLDCVGFYHSHPDGPPEPSRTDSRLAAWPGYSYVIVSLAQEQAELESWRWRGDRFEREDVRIT